MTENDVKDLLERYFQEECTPEEKALIEAWYIKQVIETPVNPEDYIDVVNKKEVWSRIVVKVGIQKKSARVISIWAKMAAASVILLIAFLFFYNNALRKTVPDLVANTRPAGNKAILTLNNGQKIGLDTVAVGFVALENGIRISKQDSDLIVYQAENASDEEAGLAINTISTPNGGKYSVQLPDGSIVFLNAASSLKYPVKFTASIREVELTGEGYFEVSKNPRQPFVVNSYQQQVKVLGTHFNIKSYLDEPVVTTLTEGSVIVTKTDTSHPQSCQLKPGEQSTIKLDSISVAKIKLGTSETIGWTDGFFVFTQAPLKQALQEISRWYDVVVTVSKDKEAEKLSITWRRTDPLLGLLNEIEKSKHLKLQIKKSMQ